MIKSLFKIKKYNHFNSSVSGDKGYAILFTVVVIGIISMITIGLSNAAYKQMVLSSVAKDSATAFYQADIAVECALFFDNDTPDMKIKTPGETYSACADRTLEFGGDEISGYTLNPDATESDSINKCFRIKITKTETASLVSTEVEAMGYNICNKGSIRTVERSLKVNY